MDISPGESYIVPNAIALFESSVRLSERCIAMQTYEKAPVDTFYVKWTGGSSAFTENAIRQMFSRYCHVLDISSKKEKYAGAPGVYKHTYCFVRVDGCNASLVADTIEKGSQHIHVRISKPNPVVVLDPTQLFLPKIPPGISLRWCASFVSSSQLIAL